MKEQNKNLTISEQEKTIFDISKNDIKLFNRMKDLQTLIKKESALKELCK